MNNKVEESSGSADELPEVKAYYAFRLSSEESRRYAEGKASELYGDADAAGLLSPERRQLINGCLLPDYVRASLIAKHHQTIYEWAGAIAFALSPVAVALVAIATLFPALAVWAYGLDLLVVMTILGFIVFADRRRSHRAWIESRFLCERIRHAMFPLAAGFAPGTVELARHQSATGRVPVWLEHIFGKISAGLGTPGPCGAAELDGVRRFIQQRWVRDQQQWYDGKLKKFARSSRRLERMGWVFFGLAVLCAIGHLWLAGLHDPRWANVEHLLTFFALVLPAAGASVNGFRTHRQFGPLADRYGNMAQALAQVEKEFDAGSISSVADLERVVRKAENMMLREVSAWLSLVKYRTLEAAG